VCVEAIGDVASVQELEKIDPTLAAGAREPGKPAVADPRHIAVVSLMARSGVVPLMSRLMVRLGEEHIDLPHRDVDSPLAQLLVQQRLGEKLHKP
jgi:hypothetical protein